MPLSNVSLGVAFESVEASVAYGAMRFRVVVLESALRTEFGADDSTQSWLDAFHANATAIEKTAIRLFQISGQSPVIVYRVMEPSKKD